MINKNLPTTQANSVYDFHGNPITVIMKDGEPWFLAKEVCDVLEIGNPSQALSRLDDDEKNTIILNEGIRGNPNKAIVSESGLFCLTLGSRKPEAKLFRKWVTSEVLPTIRKTGSYGQPAQMTPEQLMAHALIAAKETIDKQAKELQVANNSLHEIAVSAGDYCITDAAKTLGVKPSFLFAELASRKWIYKREEGGDWKGMQTAINAGYMLHKLIVFSSNDGELRKTQVRITNQGVVRLAREFAARAAEQNLLTSL